MPNMWEIYGGDAKKFTVAGDTTFALGTSRSFKVSLANDVKLSIGTEIKGGITAGLSLGRGIEFNFGKKQADKYEISWQGPADKEVKAGKSNFYNEDQFRATAGELGAATPLNVARNELTGKLKLAVGTGMILQFAATILACTTAFYATREKVGDRHGFDKDIQYDDKSVYAGSMYEAMIDGFSLIAACLSWALGAYLDGQKRDKPIRDKFFLNMDKGMGILLGAHNPPASVAGLGHAEYGPGAWHQIRDDVISFGLNADMKFNAAQTLPAGKTTVWMDQYGKSNAIVINQNTGVQIVAAHAGASMIKNIAKVFQVYIGNINTSKDKRIDINDKRSLFARPGKLEIGLDLKEDDVTLGVDDKNDLKLTDKVVKLRKGDNFLQFADNEAVLSAASVKINGNVNINGNNFSVTAASVKIGDMECLCVPDPSVAAARARSLSEIIAETAELKAREASSHVAAELIMAEAKLEFALRGTKDQINELTRELAEMKRKMEQAALNA